MIHARCVKVFIYLSYKLVSIDEVEYARLSCIFIQGKKDSEGFGMNFILNFL